MRRWVKPASSPLTRPGWRCPGRLATARCCASSTRRAQVGSTEGSAAPCRACTRGAGWHEPRVCLRRGPLGLLPTARAAEHAYHADGQLQPAAPGGKGLARRPGRSAGWAQDHHGTACPCGPLRWASSWSSCCWSVRPRRPAAPRPACPTGQACTAAAGGPWTVRATAPPPRSTPRQRVCRAGGGRAGAGRGGAWEDPASRRGAARRVRCAARPPAQPPSCAPPSSPCNHWDSPFPPGPQCWTPWWRRSRRWAAQCCSGTLRARRVRRRARLPRSAARAARCVPPSRAAPPHAHVPSSAAAAVPHAAVGGQGSSRSRWVPARRWRRWTSWCWRARRSWAPPPRGW
jgi:hypothetical protein